MDGDCRGWSCGGEAVQLRALRKSIGNRSRPSGSSGSGLLQRMWGRARLLAYLQGPREADRHRRRAGPRARPATRQFRLLTPLRIVTSVVLLDDRPRHDASAPWAKRLLDALFAGWGLFLLIPLFALIAVVIRLESRGPVLVRDIRTGRAARPFMILKFRTVAARAPGETRTSRPATDEDQRTRTGDFLRQAGLDELPILLNVLAGDMSLVGPRPHSAEQDRYYGRLIEGYAERSSVKPGLTGWAQINGSGGEATSLADMQRRVALDLWYVEHRSFALDLRIIARTLLAVLAQGGPGQNSGG